MTRYQRFVQRQRRYRRRYQLWRQNRRRKEGIVHGVMTYRRSSPEWEQTPTNYYIYNPRYARPKPYHGPLLPIIEFYFKIEVTRAKHYKPPVVRFLHRNFGTPVFGRLHPHWAVCGYAVRRCRVFKKKKKQTAFQRKLRRANYYARRAFVATNTVLYPPWDPLGRTPVDPDYPFNDQFHWNHREG